MSASAVKAESEAQAAVFSGLQAHLLTVNKIAFQAMQEPGAGIHWNATNTSSACVTLALEHNYTRPHVSSWCPMRSVHAIPARILRAYVSAASHLASLQLHRRCDDIDRIVPARSRSDRLPWLRLAVG